MTPKYPIVSDINSAPNKWQKLWYAGRHCHKLTIVVAKEFNILRRDSTIIFTKIGMRNYSATVNLCIMFVYGNYPLGTLYVSAYGLKPGFVNTKLGLKSCEYSA